MIFYSNISNASYTLDNTGIIINNSLTTFPPNILINASIFTNSSMVLFNYSNINMLPVSIANQARYQCSVSNPNPKITNPLVSFYT